MHKVSVIIPNYNHASFLKQRIDSVLAQTYQELEVIILDDCSTDGSKLIIDKYRNHPKVSHIEYNDHNSGSTFKQWMKGIKLAKGDYVWVAESDDYCENFFLEKVIGIFNSIISVGLVCTQSNIVDENNRVLGQWVYSNQLMSDNSKDFHYNGKAFVKEALVYQNSIPNASAVVFKRSVFEKIEDFETNYLINGDWQLYIKLLLLSDIYFIASPLNYFRQHSLNGSSANILKFNNIKEYYKIISVLFSHSLLMSNEENKLKNHVYKLWKVQAKNSKRNIFKSNFLEVLTEAIKVDKGIIKKLIFN